MSNNCIIFCDGASKGNPGPAGWGAIVVFNEQVKELGGAEKKSTNNRMELIAAIRALEFFHTLNTEQAIIYSDSSYVIDGITKWVRGWQKNGWLTATKKEVLNKDLWQQLENFSHHRNKKISWQYVAGHIGIAGNEQADFIATTFASQEKIKLYFGPLKDYYVNILNFDQNEEKNANKHSKNFKANAKAYSYISLVDGKIQTHKTWAECEIRVKGKTARFKKALSEQEEKAIIEEFSSDKSNFNYSKNFY